MQVIPAINCGDAECVKKHLEILNSIPAEWVHFDVSDGKFTPAVTWNEPEVLAANHSPLGSRISVEVHLMAESPEEYAERWVRAGARRIIFHIETIFTKPEFPKEIGFRNVEIGLAVLPDTPAERVYPYLDRVRFVQFLAVSPGFSGQKFDDRVLDKVRTLRERDHNVIIEVDGGVSDKTLPSIFRAGANVVVSSSFLWNHANPREAFFLLSRVV